jgi:hypothetical protein
MDTARRSFLATVLAAPLLARGVLALGQFPPPGPYAPPPRQPRQVPTPLPPEGPKINPRDVLKYNQEQIKKDVELLYELAGELRKEVSQTNSAEILSLGVVHKAEQIEKLAKQIKGLARS